MSIDFTKPVDKSNRIYPQKKQKISWWWILFLLLLPFGF